MQAKKSTHLVETMLLTHCQVLTFLCGYEYEAYAPDAKWASAAKTSAPWPYSKSSPDLITLKTHPERVLHGSECMKPMLLHFPYRVEFHTEPPKHAETRCSGLTKTASGTTTLFEFHARLSKCTLNACPKSKVHGTTPIKHSCCWHANRFATQFLNIFRARSADVVANVMWLNMDVIRLALRRAPPSGNPAALEEILEVGYAARCYTSLASPQGGASHKSGL